MRVVERAPLYSMAILADSGWCRVRAGKLVSSSFVSRSSLPVPVQEKHSPIMTIPHKLYSTKVRQGKASGEIHHSPGKPAPEDFDFDIPNDQVLVAHRRSLQNHDVASQ